MAFIHNSNLTKELIDVAKIQTSFDLVPNQIAEKVVPVIDVNPKHSRIINIIKYAQQTTTQGNTTLYTVPTGKKFYLTNAHLSSKSDVTADNTSQTLQINNFSGTIITLIANLKSSVTVDKFSEFQNYSVPIELNAGTIIRYSNGFTAGASTIDVNIMGYEVDNANA